MPENYSTEEIVQTGHPSAAEDAALAMMESAARREKVSNAKQKPWWKKLFGKPNREN